MILNKNRKVKVINRSRGALAYRIESLGIVRQWIKTGDYLNISIEELLELKTAPGGMSLLKNHLVIDDAEALRVVFDNEELEPEYAYGEAEVEHLLQEAGIDQFLDALDFAPTGVLGIIKREAIKKLPNETAKIKAMNDKFGMDLQRAHEISKEKDNVESKPAPKRRRRTKTIVESEDIELPTYNVLERERLEE